MNFYPISSLFFYRLIFMGWLIFAEGLFLYKLSKRNHFAPRVIIAIILCFGFALAFPIPTPNAFYSMFMFFCFFGFTMGMAIFCFQANWKSILFSVICGYTAEHIAYETYFGIANFSGIINNGFNGLYQTDTISLFSGPADTLIYFSSFFVVYWLIFVVFVMKLKKRFEYQIKNNNSALLVGAFFLVIDIVINSSVSYYGTIHYENFYMGFIAVTNILCCAVSLFFIYELAFRTQLKNDLEQIEKIKKAEEEQYQLTKETIDLVNIKCHDLKHQIRDIGAKDKINPETIESISKLIKIYDSSIKTGNKALDTILTEKSLLCNQRGIKFSCIADGEQLKFMSEEDTYSFFGNIIDNAIEAVSSLDEEQRIISIKIISHGNMVSISEHNPYKGEITFTNGLPNSTKNDVNYHGFGTRSIVRVCNKYNGSLSIDSEGHQYSITALFIVDKKTND